MHNSDTEPSTDEYSDCDNTELEHNQENKLHEQTPDTKLHEPKPDTKTASTREKAAVFSLFFVLTVQIITKKLEAFTPAHALNIIADHVSDGFKYLGNNFVIVSRTISGYVGIKEIALGICDLGKPLGKLFFASHNIVRGVYDAVNENVNQSMIAIITTLSIVLVFSVVAQRNLWDRLKPAHMLETLYGFFRTMYSGIGQFIAAASAIYKVLKLDSFVETAIVICIPLAKIITVPTEIIKSYVVSIGNKKECIIAGSLTLACIYAYGHYLSIE